MNDFNYKMFIGIWEIIFSAIPIIVAISFNDLTFMEMQFWAYGTCFGSGIVIIIIALKEFKSKKRKKKHAS